MKTKTTKPRRRAASAAPAAEAEALAAEAALVAAAEAKFVAAAAALRADVTLWWAGARGLVRLLLGHAEVMEHDLLAGGSPLYGVVDTEALCRFVAELAAADRWLDGLLPGPAVPGLVDPIKAVERARGGG